MSTKCKAGRRCKSRYTKRTSRIVAPQSYIGLRVYLRRPGAQGRKLRRCFSCFSAHKQAVTDATAPRATYSMRSRYFPGSRGRAEFTLVSGAILREIFRRWKRRAAREGSLPSRKNDISDSCSKLLYIVPNRHCDLSMNSSMKQEKLFSQLFLKKQIANFFWDDVRNN